MSLNINRMMVPKNKYSIKCPYSMNPEYVVVHNTANSAPAVNEAKYMISNNNQTSFHYVVDEKEVYQMIEEDRNAWHAGDGGRGKGNRSGIGIEIARSTSDKETFLKAEENGAKLVAWILQRYGWGIDRVKQHYDFSGKNCPHRTRELGWNRFLGMVEQHLGVRPTIDENKSIIGRCTVKALNVRPVPNTNQARIGQYKLNDEIEITGTVSNGWYQVNYNGKTGYVSNKYVTIEEYTKKKQTKAYVKQDEDIKNPKSRKYKLGGLEIIETTPDNIRIVNFYGKNLRQTGYSGINGGVFDTSKPALPGSTWCIAINEGKPIGNNSHTNHWREDTVKATMSYHKDGRVLNTYKNNISEYKDEPIWAIGGVCGLIPTYDTTYEKVPSDIIRKTHHTAMAYKDGKIYLIITQKNKPVAMFKFMKDIKKLLNPDSAIALDGGGSTQMSYDGKSYNDNTRRLSHGVIIWEK